MTPLKERVRDYWEAQPCNTDAATVTAPLYTRAYFEQIEEHRYRTEPQVHAFAQFTRAHGKRVLEIGVGAGTDFLQWVRAGAIATGVDLTNAAVEHTRKRLEVYGLVAEDVRVADGEALPFPDASFDLVYSWGVLHHTPDTERAVSEAVRVLRPGGTLKVMVYNRRSLVVLYLWLNHALFARRPWESPSSLLARLQESPGTRAYTAAEMRRILGRLQLTDVRVAAMATPYDLPRAKAKALGIIARALYGEDAVGWFLGAEARKR